MTLAEHLLLHLDFLGLGHTEALFFGLLPDAPDRALALMCRDAGVSGAARYQIYTRGLPGEILYPYRWALACGQALDGFCGYLHGDGPRARILVTCCAQGTGIDMRGRHLYLCTLEVWHCWEETWQEEEKTDVPSP